MKAFLALGAVVVLLGAGCTTTVQRTAEQSPVICGFLGADLCAELQPGAKGEAGLRYVNPKGTFTQYDKVMIVMVSFFGSDPGKIKPQDEQRLTDLFYKNLHDALAKLRVLSAGYALVAGTYPFAGGGQAAAKISDSVTEQTLGLAVDRRAGGGAIQTAAQWRWGDAENAIKAWSSQLADGMHAYTSGEKKP